MVPTQIYKNYNSWFLPLNTPYTITISDHLMRLVETGVLPKVYEQHVGTYATSEDKASIFIY